MLTVVNTSRASSGKGTDSVFSSVNFTLGNQVEQLTLTGGAVAGTGNAANNVLKGNSLNNTFSGLAGDDTIDAGAGNDSIKAGLGNDIVRGDHGNDSIDSGDGDDTVMGLKSYLAERGITVRS